MNSDKSKRNSGLVGRYLTVLDLKTFCLALSASVRWTKTICQGSREPSPIRKCYDSHVMWNRRQLDFEYLGPKAQAVSRDKKSASVRQADGPDKF